MTEQVVTEHQSTSPWCFIRLVDGRAEVVHLRADTYDQSRHDDVLAALRQFLSEALARHHADQVRHLTALFGDPADPDRRHVVEFALQEAEAAATAKPLPRRRWFPEQADGRDPSGDVHVSVAGSDVVVLEAPPHVFDDRHAAGQALRAALNLALDRLTRDTMKHVRRVESGQPGPTDWAGLAARADRYRFR